MDMTSTPARFPLQSSWLTEPPEGGSLPLPSHSVPGLFLLSPQLTAQLCSTHVNCHPVTGHRAASGSCTVTLDATPLPPQLPVTS